MAVDLRTVIATDVTFNNLGQVKQVQYGSANITSAQKTIYFSTVDNTNNCYIIATFAADTVYNLSGFTTTITSSQSFSFDGGGQTGSLSWQLIETY